MGISVTIAYLKGVDVTSSHTAIVLFMYRSLFLEGNLLGTNGTKKLAQLMLNHQSLPNLSELNLKSCQITDEGMKALAEGLLVKRNIRKLDLRYFMSSCSSTVHCEVIW